MDGNGTGDETIVGPLTKTIKVRVDMDQEGACWHFAIEADDKASDPYVKAGNKIDLGSGPGSGAIIEFRLQGKAGKQLKFDAADPIWVQMNSCPGKSSDFPTGVSLISCDDNTLKIGNENAGSSSVDLHYRLNFQGSLSWDPIIRNGGGGP
jgi:hypothetical protein